MRELGYVEGRNITIESRSSTRRLDLLPDLAANLLLLKVDLIVAAGDPAITAVKQATRTIPGETQVAARALGVQLQTLEVRGPDDFESPFAAMTGERAEALMTLGDPLTVCYRIQIVDLAAKSRLPSMYDLREFVEAGGLMAYGPSLPGLFRRAAAYVDKILKGTRPGDLPVE